MSPPPPPPSLTQGLAFGPRDFMQSLGSNVSIFAAAGLPDTLPWLLRVAGRPPSSPHIVRPVLHTGLFTHQPPLDMPIGEGRWETNDGASSRPFVGLSYAYHHGRLRFLRVPAMSCFDILCQGYDYRVGLPDTHHRVHRPPPYIPPPRHPPWLYKTHFLLGFVSICTLQHFHPGLITASTVNSGAPSLTSSSSSATMSSARKRRRRAQASGRKISSTTHHSSPRRKGDSRKRLGPSSPSRMSHVHDVPPPSGDSLVRLSGNLPASTPGSSVSPLTQRRIDYEPRSVRGPDTAALDVTQLSSPQVNPSQRGSGQASSSEGRAVSFASESRSYSDVARGDKEGGGSTSSRSLASYGFVPTSSPDGSSSAVSSRAAGASSTATGSSNVPSSVARSQVSSGAVLYSTGDSLDALSEVESVLEDSEEGSFLGDVEMGDATSNDASNDGESQSSASGSHSSGTATILRRREARLAEVRKTNAKKLEALPPIRRTTSKECALACLNWTAEEEHAHNHGVDLDDEPHPFTDLLPLGDRISFKYSTGLGRYPVYDALKAKELKALLKGRGQATSGNKAKLMARLHSSDKRTLARSETERLYKVPVGLSAAERKAFCEGKFRAIQAKSSLSGLLEYSKRKKESSPSRPARSRSQSVGPRRRSTSVSPRSRSSPGSPRARSHPPASRDSRVESVSSADDVESMSVDSGAQDLFPEPEDGVASAATDGCRRYTQAQVVSDIASSPDGLLQSQATVNSDELLARQTQAAMQSDPQDGHDSYSGDMNLSAEARSEDTRLEGSLQLKSPVLTSTTTTAASSTVSSQLTGSHASVPAPSSGRLLNSRPRRVVSADGVANFLTAIVPASRERHADPSRTTIVGLSKMFTVLHNNDPQAALHPIWIQEPGEDPLLPITDPSQFPVTLDAFQSWGKITNPWDLAKVRQGDMDRRTGEQKKQKSIYVTILLGSRLSLDHLLEVSTSSLNSAGLYLRKKEVDALDTQTIYSVVGIPNDWCCNTLTDMLNDALSRHEEWMQGNCKGSYDASEFMGEEWCGLLVRRTQIRLLEGSDILSPEECETVNYLYSLRKLPSIEISTPDKFRVKGCLEDFRARGKLRQLSMDCDLMELPQGNNHGASTRKAFYRELTAQMNFAHCHSTVEFEGISNFLQPARGELVDPTVGEPAFKHTSARREFLDLRRKDGKKIFRGVIQLTGSKSGTISAYYFNDDLNEAAVRSITDLASHMYQWLTKEKGYTLRSTNAILAGFTDQLRLSARDSTWDHEAFTAKSLSVATRSTFAQNMMNRGIAPGGSAFLIEDIKRLSTPSPNANAAAPRPEFSSDAMQRVAEAMRFRDKPGYNVTTGDNGSVLTDSSHVTDGAASNRSVTTTDVQARLPDMRMELNSLKDELAELSPSDPLFNDPLIEATNIDSLSVNSSESATLEAIFRDTKKALTALRVRIAQVKYPAPAQSRDSDQAAPIPASQVDRGPKSTAQS